MRADCPLLFVARERLGNRREQHGTRDGLGEEVHGAGLDGPDAHRDIAVTGHEDDRQHFGRPREHFLQFEAAGARELHVEHDAARLDDGHPREELRRGRVTLHGITRHGQKPRRRLPRVVVILDDMHDRP